MEPVIFFALAISWVASTILLAGVAQAKRRSAAGWALGAFLVFTPLLALIALATLPNRDRETEDDA